MKSLFLFAAATAAVLASAAFATPGKLPNVRAGHAVQALSGPEWERTAIYLDHVGQISYLGRTPDRG